MSHPRLDVLWPSSSPSTLAAALTTMAFHLSELWKTPPGKTFRAGLSHGDLVVMVEVKVTSHHWGDDWAQHVVNGVAAGNRCGAREAVCRLYAPVIAAAAAADARGATLEAA